MKKNSALGLAALGLMAAAASSGFVFDATPQPGSPAATIARAAELGRAANPSALAEALRIQSALLTQAGFSRTGVPRKPRAPGPGWTHRQVQRMARKKRNVKANRRAQRGLS